MRCRREKQARRAIKQNRKSGSLFWLFFFMETTGELPFWLNIILFFLFSPPLTMDAQLRTLSVLNLGLLSCFFFLSYRLLHRLFLCVSSAQTMYVPFFIHLRLNDRLNENWWLFVFLLFILDGMCKSWHRSKIVFLWGDCCYQPSRW